ncbi:MAG TPA: helix-turn-helix transcriptional regulator [Polyangiaceae bacterium]|nr:helix-turn-helix transcriptional regulator [Polyangiaceae bacterium]
MYFRAPDGADDDPDPLRHFPKWMPHTWHVFHMQGILWNFTGLGCGVAPLLPVDCWAVLRNHGAAAATVLEFESGSARTRTRRQYDGYQIDLARSTLQTQLGSFGGFYDLQVPLVSDGRCDAIMFGGPFLQALPSAQQIVEQWLELSGAPTSLHDPRLATYARGVMGLDVFEAHELEALKELLEILARALVGREDLPADFDRVARLRETVLARMPKGRARRAQRMVRPVQHARWRPGDLTAWERAELGIQHYPNAAIAIMPVERASQASDPVSRLVSAGTFQRACLKLCQRFDDALAVPLDDYGVSFLFYEPPRKNPARARLSLLDRAQELARIIQRELDIEITVGIGGLAAHPEELSECSRRALLALQLCAHKHEKSLVYDSALEEHTSSSLAAPATVLARLMRLFAVGSFSEIEVEQAAYIRAVLWESGGRPSRIRIHFEMALDGVLDTLGAHVDFDQRTREDASVRARARLELAGSSQELVVAFRDALASLARAACKPRQGELELRLTHAARFTEEHCQEALTLESVAHHVGLSPNYFCKRFKATHGIGFSEYLRRARIQQAKQLLISSPVNIYRVSEDCGFASIPHFNRVFKTEVGITPSQYRTQMGVRASRRGTA